MPAALFKTLLEISLLIGCSVMRENKAFEHVDSYFKNVIFLIQSGFGFFTFRKSTVISAVISGQRFNNCVNDRQDGFYAAAINGNFKTLYLVPIN